ncbi:hypothetical protein ABBQ32_004239 [Trebouxia sp. C0010 RCD-2024]
MMKGISVVAAGGPERLKYGDVNMPELTEGQVLIKVYATALNGADLLQRAGNYPCPPGASEILGLEAAGIVSEVGKGVTKFKQGDKVCALLDGGGYAEYAVAPEGFIMPMPKNLSFAQAAGIPEVFLTAYLELVMLGGLCKGQSVLIHAGASGVGTAAIQIAKQIDAHIFTTAGSQDKLDLARELGANRLINYKEENFVEVVQKETQGPEIKAIPGGPKPAPGVNVILDLVGASHFAGNLECLTLEGRLLLVGLPSGSKAEINLALMLGKRLQVIGSTMRARPRAYKENIVAEFSRFAGNKFETGELKPIIDTTFKLSEAKEAHEYMEAKKNKGKIVLIVQEQE